MSPPRPALRECTGQAGRTLIEVLIATAIAAMLLGPVGAWMVMAMENQGPTATRFSEASQARIANTYLSRDVASAELVKVADFGSSPGCGDPADPEIAGDAVFLQLVDNSGTEGQAPLRTVYVTNTNDDGITSVYRRTCRTSGTSVVEDQVHVLRDVQTSPSGPSATCTPVTADPLTDCRQVTFTATLAGGAPVNVRAMRRATLDPSFLGAGGNFLPTAHIRVLSQSGSRPDYTVVLSSDDASDIDGTIASRDWIIEPAPKSLTYNADRSRATAVFAATGVHDVTLTVTDDKGGTSIPVQTSILVENQSPVARIAFVDRDYGPATGPNQYTFKVNGSSSVDSDGDAIVGYQWNFGDPSEIDEVIGQGTATAEVRFNSGADLGYREITLTVTDALGATAVDRAVILLLNADGSPPPTGDIMITTNGEGLLGTLVNTPGRLPRAGTVGSGYPDVTVTFATAVPPPFTWELRRGATVLDTSTDASFAHTFDATQSGDWQIALTPDGGTTTTAEFRVNLAPSANFVVAGGGTAPAARSFNSNGSSDDHEITSHVWNFGFFGNWTSTQPNPSQLFSHPGTYTVALTVADDDGATGTTLVPVSLGGTVDPPAAGTFVGDTYTWPAVPGADKYEIHYQVTPAGSCTTSGPFDIGPIDPSASPSYRTLYEGCVLRIKHRVKVLGEWGPYSQELTR